jgi:hypothetical protein
MPGGCAVNRRIPAPERSEMPEHADHLITPDERLKIALVRQSD